MNQSTPPLRTPHFVHLHRHDAAAVRHELAHGLLAEAAQLHPKYLYDALGSRLFEALTEMPEYYLTRTEAGIFAQHAHEMAAQLAPGLTLADLGAGTCQKAARLFQALHPVRYVAVDISIDFLQVTLPQLQRQYPAIDMVGVGADFSDHLTLPPLAGKGPRLVFYPGSSIGNFSPEQALAFVRQARELSQGGGLLIGVDLVKPLAVLELAYDDPLGITAAFNRNLLRHTNHLLGSNFDVSDWRHRAFFNARESRIEMHLDALRDLTVRWDGASRDFRRGASIHTENSYKYTPALFEAMLREAGFCRIQQWRDPQNWFVVFLAQE